MSKEYDAIVVGAGPNGLAAAVRLQQKGIHVLLLEKESTIGGGTRSCELTLPGFIHDVCSAVHPLAVSSPFFQELNLNPYGLNYIHPTLCAAHPFDDHPAAILSRDFTTTLNSLDIDNKAYSDLLQPLLDVWPRIIKDVLGPLHIPDHPVDMMKFGLKAIRSSGNIAQRFDSKTARGFWAGMTAHGMLPLEKMTTAAIGLVLLLTGHQTGWPFAEGGSKAISDSLANYFKTLGGTIETNQNITSLSQLPDSKAVFFDVTPRQLVKIAGHTLSPFYRNQLKRYRYGMGVFKMDWALDDVVPFKDKSCRHAGTVHIGNSFEEIALSEKLTWEGTHAEKPFVLFSQPSIFDGTRAPKGKHVAWAYCHVPNGSDVDMTNAIENQIERYAPGFRDIILARHSHNTIEMEDYNANYIGGDINGGAMDITQLFTRPALRLSPYKTSKKGLYICSSSTPPGGGVHGMCGYHAANKALREIFHALN